MNRRWLPAIALYLIAVACANASGSPGNGGAGTLIVSQEMERSGPVYIEGYVAFIDVAQDGQKVFSSKLDFEQPLSRDLPAGDYTLTFIVRPCDGNCGYLDPPAETCSAAFEVRPGETVTAHAVERPGKDCSISIRAA